MTQLAFAKKVNLSQALISCYERNKFKPTLRTAKKLSKALRKPAILLSK